MKPGTGASTPSQGGAVPVTIIVSDNGPTAQGNAPASSATHPSTYPSSTRKSSPPPPSATHNPPGPMVAGDITVLIPNWVGMATVNVSWKAHSDATSYTIHYTVKGTNTNTDQTVPVGGTSYSYQIPADGTTCLQVQTVNQYGSSAFYPIPMYCVNSFGQVTSG